MLITDIQDGLLAALGNVSGLKTVRALSTGDIDDQDGTLVVVPNAALVMFNGAALESKDTQARTYDDSSRWLVWVVTEDLSGSEGAANSAYAVIDSAKNELAGLRVAKASGTAFCVLEDVDAQQVSSGKAVYTLGVLARTHFQKA